MKQVYRAKDAETARQKLDEFDAGPWGRKYPAIAQSWRRNWSEVIPFFAFPEPVRRIIYTTNAIGSLNAKLRKAVRSRGHFPTDDAALKLLFLVLRQAAKEWKKPPLVRPSKDGTRLEPGIAESWTVSPDGKEYSFKLRADAKFSDGTPVTAADVEFSLKRAAGEKSEWGRFFRPITTYQVVDHHTIVMKLEKPFTPIINNLAMFSASILPAKLVEAQGDAFFDKPIGSGPFALASWARGQKMELVKNPNYWEKGKPSIDGATLEIVPEDNSRVLKLKAGELDAIIEVPFNQAASLKTDPSVTVGVAPVFRIDMVQINTTKKPFDDVRVRQAMNYAIDKQAMVDGIFHGDAVAAATSIPVMAYPNDELTPYPVDLDKAKALLPFTLTGAQQRVVGQVTADMARPEPMNRLVQGAVGSGKTAVALVAACLAAAAGPLLAGVHREHIADEIGHARVGWAHLGSTRVDADVRTALIPWLPRLLSANLAVWSDRIGILPEAGVPGHALPPARELRAATIAAAREIIVPGFAHVGLPTAASYAAVDRAAR